MRCHKCGEDQAPCFFNKSGTICDDCWETFDMDRFREKRPSKNGAPAAVCVRLVSGIGVICPHCDHKVMRSNSYFHRASQVERCPKCMEHYTVKKGKAI